MILLRPWPAISNLGLCQFAFRCLALASSAAESVGHAATSGLSGKNDINEYRSNAEGCRGPVKDRRAYIRACHAHAALALPQPVCRPAYMKRSRVHLGPKI